ncbi:MAG: MerR family transcriptional regulator [Dehalococcoidia bacterium]
MQSRGVYVIRIAAMRSGMHPQTLRKYERVGFLTPYRSRMQRLYSDQDILRLKMIKYLVDEVGLNLAGVELALNLRSKLHRMERELASLQEGNPVKRRIGKAVNEMLQMVEP